MGRGRSYNNAEIQLLLVLWGRISSSVKRQCAVASLLSTSSADSAVIMAPGKNRPPPSAFRPGGKSIFRPVCGKKGGKFWSITCYRKRAEITQNPPTRNLQKKTLNKSMKHYPYTITCFWGCSAKVFSSCLCLWMSLCHCLFFGSGHVSSPLWSNISKTTSLWGLSVIVFFKRSFTHSLSEWVTRSPIELSGDS